MSQIWKYIEFTVLDNGGQYVRNNRRDITPRETLLLTIFRY